MSLVSGNSSTMATDKEVTVDSISQPSGQKADDAWARRNFNLESMSVGKHIPQVDSALANPAIAMAVEPTAEQQQQLKCPRCDSTNTKFCYYNNYNLTQPRHFCKSCRRYWTKGEALRNIPVGGGTKRSSKSKRPTPDPSPVLKPEPVSALYPPPIEAADDKMLEIYTSPGPLSCMNIDRSTGKHNSVPLVDRALSNAADLGGAAYAGSGTLRGFTRNKAPLSPTIGTPTLESFDVEAQIDEQETDFQRNALLVSGTAFLAVGSTVISAALTANYENKSGHFKALAKFLSISSIGLGLSGITVVILAFRRDHRRRKLASSLCYTSGLLTIAILVAFGILAVIGI